MHGFKFKMTMMDDISNILFQYWDPLNINDMGDLSDEYDTIAAEIISRNHQTFKVAEYLNEKSLEWGLESNHEKAKNTGRLIEMYFMERNK
jgi:predicted ATP-binding protein involved in virulence